MVVAPRRSARIALDHPVQWRTAAPLWRSTAPTDNTVLLRPALLRFTTDNFMEDFLAIAAQAPQRLGEWQVQKETWRKPAPVPTLLPQPSPTLTEVLDPALEREPLKLYQPAHQRYYLVTANLVCRIPGLPDKQVTVQKQERVSFVMRRQMRDGDVTKEHAFVDGVWQPIETVATTQLISGEQSFPMFPVTYTQTNGYARRIFTGLVPVSNREAFLNAGRRSTSAVDSPNASVVDRIAHLVTVLNVDVIGPWQNINQLSAQEERVLDQSWQNLVVERRNELLDSVHAARDKLQSASWYTLLDLAYYLRDHLPLVWDRIMANPDGVIPAGTPGQSLMELLRTTTFKPENSGNFNDLTVLRRKFRGVPETIGAISLAKALQAVYSTKDQLEAAIALYSAGDSGWPPVRFLICGEQAKTLVEPDHPNNLANRIRAALTELPPNPTDRVPIVPLARSVTATTQESDYANDLFLIRCVYERSNCPPSIHPTVVSQPTQLFQMSSYYDPDAPARPIRIPMPIDTTPAGLRKFAKNTMFVLSDTLACQVEKARDLTFADLVLSVLPWPFHKGLSGSAGGCPSGKLEFGKICSLSLPIITLCALILLIIIVSLLDIIFRWVPYLIFCLPLPGLKAKE